LKKVLIVIFILKSSLTFTQNFNDRIVTLTGDTIRCQITLVNSNNIFYNLKIKKSVQNENISLLQVKDWIIDKNNKPEILLKRQSDSLNLSTKDNSTYQTNTLVAQRTRLRDGQELTSQVMFLIGKKVYIRRYNNDTLVKGVLECVTDSSIMIKGKLIKIKDIKIISKHRGGDILIIGLSSLAVLTVAIFVDKALFDPGVDKYGNAIEAHGYYESEMAFLFCGFLDVVTVIPTGLIKLSLTRHYKMDRGWKLKVAKEKI